MTSLENPPIGFWSFMTILAVILVLYGLTVWVLRIHAEAKMHRSQQVSPDWGFCDLCRQSVPRRHLRPIESSIGVTIACTKCR